MGRRDDAQIIDERIREFRSGMSLGEVLARCPEHLQPDLQLAVNIQQLPQVVPSRRAKKTGRRKLITAVCAKRARRKRLRKVA